MPAGTSKRRNLIRAATSADGPRIAELVGQAGWKIEGLDWSLVAPFWLVCEWKGKVAGCMQLALSRPIGYQEMLAVDSSIQGFRRHAIVNDLLMQGIAVHTANGAQMVSGVIPYRMKDYKRVVQKRGGVILTSGNAMGWRTVNEQ